MPKRLIEDSIYTSDKLQRVPERYRAEYSWILPMAEANGCIEYSPAVVWRTAYSLMRPDWNHERVAEMLKAFEDAKLLFVFDHEGKRFAYFVGIENGRLPKPSDRIKFKIHESIVPADKLGKFLNMKPKEVMKRFAEIVATTSRVTRDSGARKGRGGSEAVAHSTGVGSSSGAGAGVGSRCGSSEGSGIRPSDGTGSGTSSSRTTASQNSSPSGSLTSPAGSQNKQNQNAKTELSAAELAALFHKLVSTENKKYDKSKVPGNWLTLWTKDMNELLEMYSPEAVRLLILYSQRSAQSEYNVRPDALKRNHRILHDRFKIPTRAEEADGVALPQNPPVAILRSAQVSQADDDICDLCRQNQDRCTCSTGEPEEFDDY